jgi:DNA topoisomerase I
MTKNLLIVESPAKAKTIEKILGSDFMVRSSFGHVRDLEKGGIGIDIQNNFQPNYVVTPDKTKVVNELKREALHADEVWLATDEDREGEAISWHLCEVLGLDERITKRIVFREITKPAILKAVQSPRLVDMDLVNAQQARRVLDRLVGFELSELLWKKVKGGLSAGRVQSVAVKLVVERERAIQNFAITPFFRLEAQFLVKNAQGRNVVLKAESPTRFEDEKGAEDFLKRCVGAAYDIKDIQIKPTKRKPAPPFTTSTLQQEASRKLGFSVNRTMQNAQRLYEAGFITYMRTDSTNLSETAIAAMAAEIERSFGKQYVQTRRFKVGKESAQEAHEAIRPTYIEQQQVTQDRDQQRLYELIWKRAIASQMADAELEKTTVNIGISTIKDAKLVAEGEVIKFDGFLKVYLESKDEEDEDAKGILPPLTIGQVLDLNTLTATERFTRPPARFTEAALVKELEERGIGRPSTYAATISKIMEENRGYVVKETREGTPRSFVILTLNKQGVIAKSSGSENTGAIKNQLVPTDMGMLVVDFLDKHFDDIMDYDFTAAIENQLDSVADGKEDWTKMLDKFYHPFHSEVQKTLDEAERVSGERILGKDPKSGRTILVRMGKYGPVAQIGAPDELAEKEKPTYANLKPGQSLENIDLDTALNLFELPKQLGDYEGKEIVVAAGRYGPYIKFGDAFISLPKGADPMTTTLENAILLVQEKQRADAPIFEYNGLPVTKGTGRFGDFIKWNELFINIPKRYTLDTLTYDEALELIEAKNEKEANRMIQHFAEDKISIENDRFGPIIRFGKDKFNLRREGKKLTPEEAAVISLTEVKAMIEKEKPNAFAKKVAPAKKAAAPKTATKAAAPKKAAAKPTAKKPAKK